MNRVIFLSNVKKFHKVIIKNGKKRKKKNEEKKTQKKEAEIIKKEGKKEEKGIKKKEKNSESYRFMILVYSLLPWLCSPPLPKDGDKMPEIHYSSVVEPNLFITYLVSHNKTEHVDSIKHLQAEYKDV